MATISSSASSSVSDEQKCRLSNGLGFKRLSEHARVPEKSGPNAAGYDLFAAEDAVVKANDQIAVATDIAVLFPDGLKNGLKIYGRVAPRSGLALRNKIGVEAGVVDGDYFPASVKVILRNKGHVDYAVTRGDRIAQLILEVYFNPTMVINLESVESTVTHAGFGSTGK